MQLFLEPTDEAGGDPWKIDDPTANRAAPTADIDMCAIELKKWPEADWWIFGPKIGKPPLTEL